MNMLFNVTLLSVNCTLSTWTSWGICTKTCGGGIQHRTRHITQESLHGAKSCSGPYSELQVCNNKPCDAGKMILSYNPSLAYYMNMCYLMSICSQLIVHYLLGHPGEVAPRPVEVVLNIVQGI